MAAVGTAARIDLPLNRGRPRLPAGIVERPRLVDAVDAVLGTTVTLVSAPAGSGKTTLLLSWVEEREHDLPIAWVSARPSWSGARFWATVADAVAETQGVEQLAAGDESPLEALLRTFTRLRTPLALVVDNFNDVTSSAVLQPMARLAEWAPDLLHVVLAARRDPDLPLHRLRLAGRLAEIRARDLAFTQEETSTFFQTAGLDLPDESVEALRERTEGWAAALRFAAISLRNHEDARSFVLALTRTEQAVTDYLVREVLAAQTSAMRDFLLKTSLIDKIDGELADALTGQSDGAETLEALERDNVFLELQPDGRWYRYHRLFAELLQTAARRELGSELDLVHAAAARALAAEGDRLEALRHALACGDAATAAELVGALWIELIGGEELDLARSLLARVPAPTILDEPNLCLLAAWERLASGDVAEGDTWLAAAGEADADNREAGLGRSLVVLMRARLTGDAAAVENALVQLGLPEALVQTPRDGNGRRAIVLAARGAMALWNGELRVAQSSLEAALDTARRARLAGVERDATAQLALVCALTGALKRAARLAHATGGEPLPARIALALCELQWDDAAEARAYAEEARDEAAEAADRVDELLARTVATLAVAGDTARSDDVRAELAALAEDGCDGLAVLDPLLTELRSRVALASASLAEAQEVVAAASPSPQRATAATRVALASRDADTALTELSALLGGPHDVPLASLVEGTVLRAVAADLVGAEDDARSWIERALELAEPEAIRRPFLEVGPAMATILRRTIRRGSAHRWLAGSLLAVLDGREAPEGHSARELLDPLSDRETVVLRYLPTMMSNQEIAGELFVSVNTVKTHLKSIYRKLGASDRREAVRLARELRLIG